MSVNGNSILNTIGNTPLVEIKNFRETGVRLFGKAEFFNPGGSIKDRIALNMILDAEKRGVLKKGIPVVEPTSGNTGIGLALVCAVRGYECILTMPESMSVERISILKTFGAEVFLTDASAGMAGAIKKAEEIQKERKAFMPQQFKNPANPASHRESTGPEIWKQTEGNVDFFVAGVGTGGTITGAGGFLKEKNPHLKIVAVEPASSAVLSGKTAGAHKIQGIGAGFIPEILDRKLIDEIVAVPDEEAFKYSKLLAKKEGLLVGISSGAAFFAALKIAKKFPPESTGVVILPDTGERYFSMGQYFAK